MKKTKSGFTIVELLIVIVVIAILAAISVVAYNGVQQRGRDSQRSSDITALAKAIELYYIDNGQFPLSSGSTSMTANWSTTADPTSWSNLTNQLTPYMNKVVTDPTNSQSVDIRYGGSSAYGYAYYSTGSNCGGGVRQTYILIYKLESSGQHDNLIGTCSTSALGPYANVSNYRVAK